MSREECADVSFFEFSNFVHFNMRCLVKAIEEDKIRQQELAEHFAELERKAAIEVCRVRKSESF
jgi:hypothetical protein